MQLRLRAAHKQSQIRQIQQIYTRHNSKFTANTGKWNAGQSGNPSGRPHGSKNHVTVASQNLLEGEGQALTRKLIDLALAGNVPCLRHAIDRIHPVKHSATIKLTGIPKYQILNLRQRLPAIYCNRFVTGLLALSMPK